MMRSSKSFFNKAVLSKDMTRFLPVWLIFAIMTVLNLTDIGMFYGDELEVVSYAFNSGASTNFIFALISASCLFGDLSNRRLCNAVHTLPVRRETWFATHLLAGFLFWIGPVVLKTLTYVFTLGEFWYIGLLWLGAMIVQYLFFLSLAALCAICTGTKVGMTAMYLLINFGSMLAYALVSSYYQPLMPGVQIPDGWALFLCPIGNLMEGEYIRIKDIGLGMEYEYVFEGLGATWWYLLGIAVLTVGLVALGIFAYRKRKLENAGEFVVFRPLKPVIWVLLTLTMGLIFQGIGLLSGTVTVFLLIGLTVGGMLAEMLVMKSGKTALKGLAKGGILAAIVGVSIFVVSLDPLGVVRWVPEVDQVEYVRISDSFYYTEEEDEYYPSLTLKDSAGIQHVLDAHKLLTEVGQTEYTIDFTSEYRIGQIYIRYQMKDGSVVVRRYYYDDNPDTRNKLDILWNRADFMLEYEDWDEFLKGNQAITVSCLSGDYTLNAQQSKELLTAVKADCDEGTWDRSGLWENYGYCSISLNDGGWVEVSAGCKNTVQWFHKNLPVVFQD